jgi:hypothetical protein
MTPTGAVAFDAYGTSVASIGDFNGDGFDDWIAGALGNDAGGLDAGRAYIYFGRPSPDTTADMILTGQAAGDEFGAAVAGAGDVNGDGFDDVIVGASRNDLAGANAGSAFVYYGGSIPNATADLVLIGAAPGDRCGYSVAGAGDINGDGFDDMIVGAIANDAGGTDAGRAYVYFGGMFPNATADLVLTGAAAFDAFGTSVARAGDFNADGFDDVIVGAPFSGGTGRAFVYLGANVPEATADLTLLGEAANDVFGFSVGGGGDVNGDGFDDLIVEPMATTTAARLRAAPTSISAAIRPIRAPTGS